MVGFEVETVLTATKTIVQFQSLNNLTHVSQDSHTHTPEKREVRADQQPHHHPMDQTEK